MTIIMFYFLLTEMIAKNYSLITIQKINKTNDRFITIYSTNGNKITNYRICPASVFTTPRPIFRVLYVITIPFSVSAWNHPLHRF